MRRWTVIVLAVAALAAAACGPKTVFKRVYRPQYEDALVKDLVEKYQKQEVIDELEDVTDADERNRYIDELLYLTDVAFYNYSGELCTGKAVMDTGFDISILTLGALGAISTQSHIQTILAASSAGAAGARASIDKNFFNENGMDAIVAVMRASRAEILVNIRKKMTLPIGQYSMQHALADITEYNAAGSVTHALAAIQKTSGAKEEATDETRTKFYEDLVNSKEIFTLRAEIYNLLEAKGKEDSRKDAAVQWFKDKKEMTLSRETVLQGIVGTPLSATELKDLMAALENVK